jgi:hypothetical protein
MPVPRAFTYHSLWKPIWYESSPPRIPQAFKCQWHFSCCNFNGLHNQVKCKNDINQRLKIKYAIFKSPHYENSHIHLIFHPFTEFTLRLATYIWLLSISDQGQRHNSSGITFLSHRPPLTHVSTPRMLKWGQDKETFYLMTLSVAMSTERRQ